jgi:hypothetical protein
MIKSFKMGFFIGKITYFDAIFMLICNPLSNLAVN